MPMMRNVPFLGPRRGALVLLPSSIGPGRQDQPCGPAWRSPCGLALQDTRQHCCLSDPRKPGWPHRSG
eukprot:8035578-Pyramimonas_sp.AAC.1